MQFFYSISSLDTAEMLITRLSFLEWSTCATMANTCSVGTLVRDPSGVIFIEQRRFELQICFQLRLVRAWANTARSTAVATKIIIRYTTPQKSTDSDFSPPPPDNTLVPTSLLYLCCIRCEMLKCLGTNRDFTDVVRWSRMMGDIVRMLARQGVR